MAWLAKAYGNGKVARKIPRYGRQGSAMVWWVSDQSTARNPSDPGQIAQAGSSTALLHPDSLLN